MDMSTKPSLNKPPSKDKRPSPPRHGMKLADKHAAADDLAIEIKDLQSRMRQGSKHTKATFRKRIHTASTRFNRYQTEIARTESCRALWDKIRVTLPREVRDMIYEYVIEAHNVAVDVPTTSNPPAYSGTLHIEYPDCLGSGSPPRDCGCAACTEFFDALDAQTLTPRDRYTGFLYFLRDEEQFGAEVQGELAETYYGVTTFTLHHHRTIFKPSEEEMWVFGNDSREAIRKLDVFLGEDYLLTTAEPSEISLAALWVNIEELRNFGKNCHTTFHITARPRFNNRPWYRFALGFYQLTEKDLTAALDALFVVIKRLRDDGWKVSVLPGAGVVGQDDVAAFVRMDLDADRWIDKVHQLRSANYGTL